MQVFGAAVRLGIGLQGVGLSGHWGRLQMHVLGWLQAGIYCVAWRQSRQSGLVRPARATGALQSNRFPAQRGSVLWMPCWAALRALMPML